MSKVRISVHISENREITSKEAARMPRKSLKRKRVEQRERNLEWNGEESRKSPWLSVQFCFGACDVKFSSRDTSE
jgi:hypothetical protein